MDRNIITAADAAAWDEEPGKVELPPSVVVDDGDEFSQVEKGGGRRPAPSKGPVVPGAPRAKKRKPDEWQDRLLKFIPLEAVGLYLGIDATLRSAQLTSLTEQRVWFGLALAATLLFTWVYLRRKGKVSRVSQLAASLAAVLVWVFAMGGIFATFSFYKPWQGTVLLVISTYFLSVMPLKPLTKER